MSPLPPIATAPAAYFPFENGRHEAKPGLFKLGQHEVHGRVETHVFMFDRATPRYLANKAALRRHLHRHYVQAALPPALREAAARFVATRLAHEHPEAISFDEATGLFTNRWLGWAARLDLAAGTVKLVERSISPYGDLYADVEPVDAFDFLALNCTEDLSLVAREPATGEDWLPVLHVSAPHHWDPREKVGRSFAPVHAPVADAEALRATGAKLMKVMIEQGPYLRFAWGMAGNDTLNHHPDAAHGLDRAADVAIADDLWQRWFLRVERQVLWGFPEANGALFTIRPYWYPLPEIAADPVRREQLARALADMSPAALAYKSMERTRDPLVKWLHGPGAAVRAG